MFSCVGVASAFRRDVALVLLDALDELLADGNVVAEVEIVVDGAEGHRLGFLHEGEPLEILAVVLVLAQQLLGLEQRLEDALLRGPAADDVGSDAVDAGVEIVESDVSAVEGVAAYELFEEVERGVVHDGDVVAVPAHGSGDVEHEFGHIHEERGDEVGDVLCGLVVASVEGVDATSCGAVGGVEVVEPTV